MIFKKIAISILTVALLVSSTPISAFAEENKQQEQTEQVEENNLEEVEIERDLSTYQTMINNLPDVSWINAENLDQLTQKLTEVKTALDTLSDEEYEQLDLTKYDALVVKYEELSGNEPMLLTEEPPMLLTEEPSWNVSNTSTEITVSLYSNIAALSSFSVTLPKEVDVTSNEKTFDYSVSVSEDNSYYVDVYAKPSVELKNGTNSLMVSVSNSNEQYTSSESGTITLKHSEITEPGNWTCDLPITIGLYKKPLGIKRDTNSNTTQWTRTWLSSNYTATASKGGSNYQSSFDSNPLYSQIKRVVINSNNEILEYNDENKSKGDVMVQIPKFYYQRYVENGIEYINISKDEIRGYTLHPAFNHNESTQDYIYVGAYKTSNGNQSVSNAMPSSSLNLSNATRNTFRTQARSKYALNSNNKGWGIIDVSTLSAIQMLILVEYADNNVQEKIGKGISNYTWNDGNNTTNTFRKTGSCDSMYNNGQLSGILSSTNDGKSDVLWRGIEGFWGNVWEWTDGLNFNGGTYYVCNDQSKYADDTATNYTKIEGYSGSTSWSASYITKMGIDNNNSWCMMPSAAGSGSATTYFADVIWSSSTHWRVLSRGGYWANGDDAGLFALAVNYASSDCSASNGSRLLYVPS